MLPVLINIVFGIFVLLESLFIIILQIHLLTSLFINCLFIYFHNLPPRYCFFCFVTGAIAVASSMRARRGVNKGGDRGLRASRRDTWGPVNGADGRGCLRRAGSCSVTRWQRSVWNGAAWGSGGGRGEVLLVLLIWFIYLFFLKE